MEFNEKLQELRKQKGITQEELAEMLFVSRSAISKWESGGGYPNIDSLKALSNFYSITIDELLSSDELLAIAEEDNKQKENSFNDLIFGLLDISVAVFLFLPLFAQKTEGIIQEVPFLSLTEISTYLRVAYGIIVFAIILCGVLTLSLQNFRNAFWDKYKNTISIILSAVGALVFMVSLQPYPAAVLFLLLMIKVIILLKRR